jgi:hypothetical protein
MCFSTGIPSSARERESVQDLETICLRLITMIKDAHSFEDKPRLAHSVHHEGSALCFSPDCLDRGTGLGIEAAKSLLLAMFGSGSCAIMHLLEIEEIASCRLVVLRTVCT